MDISYNEYNLIQLFNKIIIKKQNHYIYFRFKKMLKQKIIINIAQIEAKLQFYQRIVHNECCVIPTNQYGKMICAEKID